MRLGIGKGWPNDWLCPEGRAQHLPAVWRSSWRAGVELAPAQFWAGLGRKAGGVGNCRVEGDLGSF